MLGPLRLKAEKPKSRPPFAKSYTKIYNEASQGVNDKPDGNNGPDLFIFHNRFKAKAKNSQNEAQLEFSKENLQ